MGRQGTKGDPLSVVDFGTHAVLVPLLHPESNNCAASAEMPSAVYPHWIVSMQLIEVGPSALMDDVG